MNKIHLYDKIFSIDPFKVFLLALWGTLKTILFCSDKFVDFSVTTGNNILSYKLNLSIIDTFFPIL